MIKAVIFDLDDTLYPEIEYVESGFKTVSEYLLKKGYKNYYNELLALFEEDKKEVFNRLIEKNGLDVDVKDMIEIYRNHIPEINFYEDVEPFLEYLKNNNIKIGIITDGRPEGQKAKLKALKCYEIFDNIIITDELGGIEFRKPNPLAFEKMAENLNLQYEEMLYIGDNPEKDFDIKKYHSVNTVQINREGRIHYEKISCPSDLEISVLNKEIILSFNNKSLVKDLREIQLKILKELDRFCKENNLRYYLAWGTLLGAIRHKGFIPWDDDIDIFMPYKDVKQFEKIAFKLNDDFFFQTHDTDPEYVASISRIRLNNTSLKEIQFVGKNIHHGVFIDIYPLYGAGKTRFKRIIQMINAALSCLYLWKEPIKNHGAFLKYVTSIILKITPKKWYEKIYEHNLKHLSKYDYDTSEIVYPVTGNPKSVKKFYEKNWFGEGKKVEFENELFTVPLDYHNLLTKAYGDYMTLPSEEKRCFHHTFVEFDFYKGVTKKNKE